jgi:hypothetical protein
VRGEVVNPEEIEMDFNKVEAQEIERIANDADAPIRELSELQLALVGGGCGEVIIEN